MAEPDRSHLPGPDEVRALRAEARRLDEVVPCAHSAEQLWPYFSQVDLYNRAGGSSAVEYEVEPNIDEAAMIRGTARKLGLTMRYQELPYEWVEPRFVYAEMFFESGPFRYTRIGGELLREQRAARYFIEYVPKWRFGIAGLLARSILKKFVAVFRGIDEGLPETIDDPLGAFGFADRSETAQRRGTELAQRWRHLAVDAVVPEALAEFIATAPDTLVGRMRPYGLALQLGTSRSETLEFCCRAAHAEFLDLRWDLICPSCGGAKRRNVDLEELGSEAHCDVCNIRYDADLTRNVELSFRPRPDIRTLDDREYCLQSPSHQRRILAQVNVEPGAVRRLSLSLTPGHYRLRCIGRDGEALFDSAYGRPRQELEVHVGTQVDPLEISCGSVLDIDLRNDSPHWRTVRFERHGYREDAACAAEVLEMPEFRETFGENDVEMPSFDARREG